MVEHRRVELLASTMPLWRATNCANAPCNVAYYNRTCSICKEGIFIFLQLIFCAHCSDGDSVVHCS